MLDANVCVVGCGYVGLTLAVYMARHGLRVHGVDISTNVLSALSHKKAHFYEANFDPELAKAIDAGTFTFSDEIPNFRNPVTYIVTVGTPLRTGENVVNLDPLKAVAKSISERLKDGDTVILRSTVKVGVTRGVVKPILDVSGRSYSLCFCPERTVEGKAFDELSNLPQIVSGIDLNSLAVAKSFFAPIAKEIVPMGSVEEAEMVKLLNNSERDIKFAIANEIALMCEAKNLDAYSIINAANYKYPRSSLKYPGPVGGPCLEKDPYILTEGFLDDTYTPVIFKTGRMVNELMLSKFFGKALEIYTKSNSAPPRVIGICGFAFKGNPPTGDIRGSMVIPLISEIRKCLPNVVILGHDYLATSDDMIAAGANKVVKDLSELIDLSDFIILQNNHPSYFADPAWKMTRGGQFIFDFWNQLQGSQLGRDVYYHVFGRGAVVAK